MRTGVYAAHHSLSSEAAAVVRQALSLARRRGHVQVTPLHVAIAMLASSTGLLQSACLQFHSHPLQSKALELCFNVSLNRLPTSASSSPILGPHSHHPCLSNALIAAFKRAQTHQRRGSTENQQQPILALKVEIQQLIISILDDPSVSRVMREAGFSSTQVKTNLEQAVSLKACSQSPHESKENKKPLPFNKNDVMSVIDTMMRNKRKNSVIVGECLASAEGVIKGVINKFESGDSCGNLKFVQFVSLPLYSLRHLSREEVQKQVEELRCFLRSYVGKGVVLYLGDLKWVSEFWSSYCDQRTYYSPLEHMIMELGILLSGFGESGKFWLMGVATFHTYMRCQTGHPSLETLWDLHPLTIPADSLGLSLNLESDFQDKWRKASGEVPITIGIENNLTCSAECSKNFTREAQSIASTSNKIESTTTSNSSSLPSWLQQYKDDNRRWSNNDQDCQKVGSRLCKKWNSICSSIHKQPNAIEKTLHLTSLSPSSNSLSSQEHRSLKLHPNLLTSPKEHQFFISEFEDECFQTKTRPYISDSKPDLLSNPNSSPNSASSSEASDTMEGINIYNELNSENLKILCNALEKRVPWQRSIILEIVSTILQCRSGMLNRNFNLRNAKEKKETWLFFLGVDSEGKEKIARELAKVVFGSRSNNFVAIGLGSFSSTRADSTDQEFSNKRARDGHGQSYFERFSEAVEDNPSRVFFIEDVEQVDYHSQLGIKRAIERGGIPHPIHGLVPLKDAIVIFSCESFSSVSRACSPPTEQRYSEPVHRTRGDKSSLITLEQNDKRSSNESNERIALDLNIGTEDDTGDEVSVSDIGILDSVDRQVVFKLQML